MRYCFVNSSGIIENIVVFDNPSVAEQMGFVPFYDDAKIGDEYNPPHIADIGERMDDLTKRNDALEAENKKLATKLKLADEQMSFLEDCVLELGDAVYA